MPANVDKIIEQLWQSSENNTEFNVFAVLDAARDEIIYENLARAASCISLFRGEKALEMALVAPYLVWLKQYDPFTSWVIHNGWDNHWGFFIQSPADFGFLKRHLRSLLQVFDEEGNPLFFRFYDPRVFRVYLPTCNSSELKTVFGPVTCFCLPDDDADKILRFRKVGDELLTKKNAIL